MTSGNPSPEFLAIFGFIDAEEYLRLTDAAECTRPAVSQGTKDKLRESNLLRWRKRKGVS